MSNGELPVVTGEILEEELTLSIEELCGVFAGERERILELVEQGVLEMHADEAGRFGGEVLRRARIALRLQRDLGLNAAGASLVIELLERIELLEARNRRLSGEA